MWKPDYVTSEDAKDYLRIDVDDDGDDTELPGWITAASRTLDTWANRQFGQVDEATTLEYGRASMWTGVEGWSVAIDDLASAVGLTIAGTAYADTGAVLGPRNALILGQPYTKITFPDDPRTGGVLSMTSDQWGWTEVPAPVVLGTKMTLARFNKLRGGALGVMGSPNGDGEQPLLSAVDPTVSRLLFGLKRRQMAR